jgi:cytochrome c oxidase subunit 3
MEPAMSQTDALQTDSYPAEQFQEIGQQHHAASLGTWTFLATEVLFFGVLFTSFTTYRVRWTHDFAEGAKELKWYLGGLNTAVLLTSSYFMAVAVHAAAEGKQRKLTISLILTLVLGLGFLVIKGTEYAIEYHEHLVPMLNYSPVSPDGAARPPHLPLFMGFYFVMTGFHALHVITGLVLICVLIVMARRSRFNPDYCNPVEMIGLYWHFVDIVWVFLFPSLYLLRHST